MSDVSDEVKHDVLIKSKLNVPFVSYVCANITDSLVLPIKVSTLKSMLFFVSSACVIVNTSPDSDKLVN